MSKFIVVTSDNKQVYGYGEEMWARANRPSVVVDNTFISNHVSLKQISILATVTDEATDEDFAAEWPALLETAKGDVLAAVASYAELYSLTKPAKAAK